MMWISRVAGLRAHDLLEERHKLVAGMPLGRLPQDEAALRLERGVEGQRAVPDIFEAVPLRAARRQRQNRVAPIQRLNRRLLVHAKHGGMLRRVEIEPDDLGRLRFEIRVGRSQVPLQSMRLQSGPFPGARHDRVRHAQLLAQATRRPMGRAVTGRFTSPAQNPGLDSRGQHARLGPAVAATQSGNPVRLIPPFPFRDGGRRAIDALADGRIRIPIGQQQNDSGASACIGTHPMAARQRFQARAVFIGQRDRSDGRHRPYYH